MEKRLYQICYSKLADGFGLNNSLVHEIKEFVNDKTIKFIIPVLFKSDDTTLDMMYNELKSDKILKRVFIEACMKSSIPSLLLYKMGKGTFGNYDLLFYIYICCCDFKKSLIYQTNFRSSERFGIQENTFMNILKIMLYTMFIVLIIAIVVYAVIHIYKIRTNKTL